jgi:adenylate kinase
MKKKSVIILLGPPGSGKGTQADLVSSKLNLYYLETSKLIERSFEGLKEESFIEADGEKFYLKKEKEFWQTGALCSPPFVSKLIIEKIEQLYKEEKGIVFSGSPRTIYESKKIIPQIDYFYGRKNLKVIFINVSPEDTIYRNSRRRICTLMRHSILYLDENKDLKFCPLDGSMLVRRKGLDNPEVIKKRIEEFNIRTMPIIDFFKENKIKVDEINGARPPVDVFNEILKIIND